MKKTLKILPFEIKSLDDENRSFDAVASTEDIDRDGDRIMAAGWDVGNFLKNPVIPWAHNYAEPPVAKAVQISVKDGRLMFRPKFPTAEEYPFADTIWKLYKGGYLKAFSVGFMPKRWEYVERGEGKRGRDYMEQELWEISACTVPSNPNALVAAKSAGVINDQEAAMLEPESRGIGETENGEPGTGNDLSDIMASIDRINKCLDILGGNIETLLKDRPQPEPTSEDPSIVNRQSSIVNPPTLTPEDLKAALADALAGIEQRIEAAVETRITYHLGIVK